jgi:putative phage-type endonuclease
MRLHYCKQRSDEWHALRLGRITATSFQTMANGGPKSGRDDLCLSVAAERFFHCPAERPYTNGAMQNGIDKEDAARQAYEIETLCHVDQVGFAELDEYIGCSPDGLVGDDGGVEIKCPELKAHSRYYSEGADGIDSKYRWQIQGALWITGRKWWDFVSYLPEARDGARIVIVRILPDPDAIEKLEVGAGYCRQRIADLVKGFEHVSAKS